MNNLDMAIERTDSGFCISYRNNTIAHANVNCNIGTIAFTSTKGTTVTVDVSEYVEMSKAYNSPFGITLTDDGTRFFVQSWEKGLFCFDIQTGILLWHNPQKRAYDLATKGNEVLCHYQEHSICVLDAQTGTLSCKYSYTVGNTFLPLSANHYFVGPKRGYYEILDFHLKRHAKVSKKELNPKEMDNFLIQKASLVENELIIYGVEYITKAFLDAIRSKNSEAFINNSRFTRKIPISIR